MYKVMIVDDEYIFREYMKQVIDWDNYGFHITHIVRDGEEAIRAIKADRPHLIFTDINMPRIDGLDLSSYIKSTYPEIFIGIITAYSEFEYARKALKLGVEEFILKPFDSKELIEFLNIVRDKLDDIYMPSNVQGEQLTNVSNASKLANQTRSILEEHFKEVEFKISDISKILYVDSSYIRRAFRKEYNVSVTEYLIKLRMEEATRLLKEEEIKIIDTGRSVGIDDVNYFSRLFKKYYGISPRTYKNLLSR